MPNTTYLAHRITGYLSAKLNLDEDRKEVILYALDIFLASMVNILLAMFIAYLLGVVRYAFIVLFSSSSLRYFSGGAHCSSSGRCIIAGSVTIPLFGLAAQALAEAPLSANPLITWSAYIVVVLFSLLSIFFWSPADAPGKPISTKLARDILRRNSFICALVIGAVVLYYMLKSPQATYSAEIYAALLGIVWQSFSLSPTGYSVIHRLDRFLQLRGIS